MNLLSSFIVLLFMKIVTTEWIDPHDLNIKVKEKYKKMDSLSLYNKDSHMDVNVCHSHMKRIISILMNSAYINKENPTLYDGHIRFQIDPEDFQFLTSFAKGDISLDGLRKLDTVLSESFKKSLINDYLDILEGYQMKLYSTIINIQNLWLLGVAFMLYIVYQLFKNEFSVAYIIKYLMILVLICDFGFRYKALLEEAEEHNASITYSAVCDTTKMSFTEYARFIFSSQNCERKVITPLDTFLYQIKNIIIIPLHAVGTGLGDFGHGMFTHLPWGFNIIFFPLMLVFCVVIFIFIMAFCTGQTIEFNLFHLVKLKFGGSSTGKVQNVITGKTLDRLVDGIIHRPMVENIKVEATLKAPINKDENKQIHEQKAIKNDHKNIVEAKKCDLKSNPEEKKTRRVTTNYQKRQKPSNSITTGLFSSLLNKIGPKTIEPNKSSNIKVTSVEEHTLESKEQSSDNIAQNQNSDKGKETEKN